MEEGYLEATGGAVFPPGRGAGMRGRGTEWFLFGSETARLVMAPWFHEISLCAFPFSRFTIAEDKILSFSLNFEKSANLM